MCFLFSRIKTIHVFDIYSPISKYIIVTSLIGFNIDLTNVDARLKQRCINVLPTFFRRCFNVSHWRCINVVQRWKSDVEFCFISNVGSTLFQRWSTSLKQHWSNVEMLTGNVLKSNVIKFYLFWTTNSTDLMPPEFY